MSTQIFNLDNEFGGSQNATFPTQSGILKDLISAQSNRTGDFGQQMDSNLLFFQKKLSQAPKSVADAVQVDPAIMHGNPVFSGTRIPIYQIIEELADGTPFEDLCEGYPSLDPDLIRRGLDFVASLLRVNNEEVSN